MYFQRRGMGEISDSNNELPLISDGGFTLSSIEQPLQPMAPNDSPLPLFNRGPNESLLNIEQLLQPTPASGGISWKNYAILGGVVLGLFLIGSRR